MMGTLNWKTIYKKEISSGNFEDYSGYAQTIHLADNGLFYVGGAYGKPNDHLNGIVLCYTGSGTSPMWTKIIDTSFDPTIFQDQDNQRANPVYDIESDHEGNLLVAAIVGGHNDPFVDHLVRDAEGRVYNLKNDLNPAYGGDEVRDPVNIGSIQAFDLKIGITPTADNGFVVVSTKRLGNDWDTEQQFLDFFSNNPQLTPPDWPCYYMDYNSYQWNTDAYVAKYKLNSSDEWVKKWDMTVDPPGDREPFPGDLKQQECVYQIYEADDGGIVVCGNTSHNFDDYYLFKIHSDCEMYSERYVPSHYSSSWVASSSGTPFIPGVYELTSPTLTWSGTYYLTGVLVIPDGKKLILDGATLYFSDDAAAMPWTGIIVKHGGELEIKNNSLLTSNPECPNSMWSGIEVQGIDNVQHYQDQGKIIVRTGSAIKNSRFGICVGCSRFGPSWAPYVFRGGIAQIDDAVFENNRYDLTFSTNTMTGNAGFTNNSFVKRSSFLSTDLLRDPHYILPGTTTRTGTNTHIRIGWVNGLLLTDNTFQGTDLVDPSAWATGIYSYNANYKLDCGSKSPDGHCISTGNLFSKLKRGVQAGGSISTAAPSINGCQFDEIEESGILLNNIFYADITTNDFDFSLTNNYNCRGLYLYNCQKYVVEGNLFEGATATGGNGIGVNVQNSSEALDALHLNQVYNNVYQDVLIGNFGNGFNHGGGASNKGLRFKCNDYYASLHDQAVTVPPGISVQQGVLFDQKSPAGNRFDGCSITDGELYNNGEHFTYVHHQNNGTDIVIPDNGCYPDGTGYAEVELENAFIAFNQEEACPANFHPVDRRYRMWYFMNQTAEAQHGAQDFYNANIDGNRKSFLLELINADVAPETVADEMLEDSPYLSDEVLIALLKDKPTPMPEDVIVPVLVANSPLTAEVMYEVVNRSPAFSSGSMDDINNAQTGISAREELENELLYYTTELELARNEYVRSVLHDYTDSNRLDTLIHFISQEEGPMADYDLASLYLQKGDYGKAATEIEDLGRVSGFEELAALLDMQRQWMEKGASVDTLNEDSLLLGTVLDMAASDGSPAQHGARVMLEHVFEVMPEEPKGEYDITEIVVLPGEGGHSAKKDSYVDRGSEEE